MTTILDLAKDIADDLGHQRPISLFAAYDEGDLTDRKILRALTRTCRYLAGEFDWQVLKARHMFAALAQIEQTGKIPADFLRLIDDTFRDDDVHRSVCGPLSDTDYADALTLPIARVEPVFYIGGDTLSLIPVPVAGVNYSFSYIRTVIGKDKDGVYVSAFSADDDVALWDDELLTLGTVFHYRKNERLDYKQDEFDFKKMMRDRIKADGGPKVIRMGGGAKSSADLVARMKSAALFIEV